MNAFYWFWWGVDAMLSEQLGWPRTEVPVSMASYHVLRWHNVDGVLVAMEDV